MATWVNESIKELREKYNICEKNNEKALSFYISCFIKILNGMVELDTTYFHYYERRILWFPMRLFSKYFAEQIAFAINTIHINEKNNYIEDIEKALANISEVYRNVVDGTVNSDRRMIATLGIDTNLYELSPKLCSFYSVMLAEMVKTFDSPGEDRKYAFFLYPTFRRYTEMKILFEHRKDSGKIAVVNISNSIIEQYKILPIMLGHEMFHVLLREERLPKKRAKSLYSLMHLYVHRVLFSGIKFDSSDIKDSRIKKELVNIWFHKASEEARILEEVKENDRMLYSEAISRKCVNYINATLIEIIGTLEADLRDVLCSQKEISCYTDYESLNQDIRNYIEMINRNIYEIIAGRTVTSYCNIIMSIFREVYADIACLITLEIPAEVYCEAFHKSEFFSYESSDYSDYLKWIRIAYVANTLIENTISETQADWKNLHIEARNKIVNTTQENLTCKSHTEYVIISEELDNFFCTYFLECAAKIRKFIIKKGSSVALIQSTIKNILETEQKTFLKDVLSGTAEYKYFNVIKCRNGGNEIENSN